MAVRPSGHRLVDGLVFEDALCRAPATPLEIANNSQPLLLAGGATLASLNADAKQLTVAATLFDADASLVRRTGYLVFWSRMLHHLAAWRDEPLTLPPVRASRTADAASNGMILKAGMGNFDLVRRCHRRHARRQRRRPPAGLAMAAHRRAGADDARSVSQYPRKNFLMFLHPSILCLLLLPLLLAVYQLRKSSANPGRRRWATAGLRLLAMSLVIVALARPFQRAAETNRSFVAVVDCSPSMDAAAMAQAAAGLKELAAQAGRQAPPGGLWFKRAGSDAGRFRDDDRRPWRSCVSANPAVPWPRRWNSPPPCVRTMPTGSCTFSAMAAKPGAIMVKAAAGLGRRGLELQDPRAGNARHQPGVVAPGALAGCGCRRRGADLHRGHRMPERRRDDADA